MKALSMPVAPAELDLDETLKAEKSFLSPVVSGDESGDASASASNSRSDSGNVKKKTKALPPHLASEDSESESVGSGVSV